MRINRIEFNDKDDPESSMHQNEIRFQIAPEGMIITLPNGSKLGSEDQKVLGQLLRMAYEQGKRVGRQL